MPEAATSWPDTLRRLGRDADRSRRYQLSKFGYIPLTWFLDPGFLCVFLHRLSHAFWTGGHRVFGRLCMQLNSLLTGADIHPAADLGGGLLVPSPCGTTISARAGDDLVVLALGGLGGSVLDRDIGAGIGLPVVGERCRLGQACGVQGSIRLGDDVTVDAGAGVVIGIASGSRIGAARPELISTTRLPADCSTPSRPAASRASQPCFHAEWRYTRAALVADIDRLLGELARFAPNRRGRAVRARAATTNPLLAIAVYRISHWLFLNKHWRLAMFCCQLNVLLHKLTIPPSSCIGDGLLMPHLAGTLFSGRAGSNLTLYSQSVCSGTGGAFADLALLPKLGDNVMLGGHAGVFGPVSIGNGVNFGPKAQADADVGDHVTVWSRMMAGSMRKAASAGSAEDPPVIAEPCATLAGRARSLHVATAWRSARSALRQDRARLDEWGGPEHPRFVAMTCVRLFRASHFFFELGWRGAARWCWLWNVYLTGADIAPASELGGGLLIPHAAGVAVYGRAGERLTLLALSGIGSALDTNARLPGLDDAPRLGNGVTLAPHSGIYGRVEVGDQVVVSAGCAVSCSVPDRMMVVPRPLMFRGCRPAGTSADKPGIVS